MVSKGALPYPIYTILNLQTVDFRPETYYRLFMNTMLFVLVCQGLYLDRVHRHPLEYKIPAVNGIVTVRDITEDERFEIMLNAGKDFVSISVQDKKYGHETYARSEAEVTHALVHREYELDLTCRKELLPVDARSEK
jgi:hypothetical protein